MFCVARASDSMNCDGGNVTASSVASSLSKLYYPEYLPDIARPLALPFSSAGRKSLP
jgi:hypothetical protein